MSESAYRWACLVLYAAALAAIVYLVRDAARHLVAAGELASIPYVDKPAPAASTADAPPAPARPARKTAPPRNEATG